MVRDSLSTLQKLRKAARGVERIQRSTTTGRGARREIRRAEALGSALHLSLADVTIPRPAEDEVVVRVEAAPMNPSDIGLLLGPADLATATQSGSAERPVVVARVPPRAMSAVAGRMDQPLPIGNEGAGVVVEAGSSPAAQALLGRVVAALGGGMFAEFRCLKVDQCLAFPAGTSARDAASAFVNPLTALGMVETMRREGHSGLVHTAAASNLGQMLIRICQMDGIPLVNIVRRPDQAALLKAAGATHVCDSSASTFIQDLTDALAVTGSTLAFDATGGGRLAGDILTAMEAAAARKASTYSRYGTAVHKQVYIYGRLDPSPLELAGNVGMAWSVGGWLLFPFLERIGREDVARLRARVAAEITTTFASHYTAAVTLDDALRLDVLSAYARRSTGAKYLVVP